jgi:hypothetical protein
LSHDPQLSPNFFFFLPEVSLVPRSSYLRLPGSWDYRHAPPRPAFWWDSFSLTFYPDWSQTTILPISTSWVSGIIGMTTMQDLKGSRFYLTAKRDFRDHFFHIPSLCTWNMRERRVQEENNVETAMEFLF